jgi:hypothetical protein
LTVDRRRIPIYDATAPIVCTLSAGEVQERRDLLEWLRTNLAGIDRTEHGMLLHFPAGEHIEGQLQHFATAEKRCCRFWGFAVEQRASTMSLRWDAPPAADELVDRLLAYFLGDPDADLSGLL